MGGLGPSPGQGVAPPPKKNPEKYFSSGKCNVKFGHISGKYCVKFEHFVNLSYIKGKNALPPAKVDCAPMPIWALLGVTI